MTEYLKVKDINLEDLLYFLGLYKKHKNEKFKKSRVPFLKKTLNNVINYNQKEKLIKDSFNSGKIHSDFIYKEYLEHINKNDLTSSEWFDLLIKQESEFFYENLEIIYQNNMYYINSNCINSDLYYFLTLKELQVIKESNNVSGLKTEYQVFEKIDNAFLYLDMDLFYIKDLGIKEYKKYEELTLLEFIDNNFPEN